MKTLYVKDFLITGVRVVSYHVLPIVVGNETKEAWIDDETHMPLLREFCFRHQAEAFDYIATVVAETRMVVEEREKVAGEVIRSSGFPLGV